MRIGIYGGWIKTEDRVANILFFPSRKLDTTNEE